MSVSSTRIQKCSLEWERDTPASHLGAVHNPSLFTLQPVGVSWGMQMSSALGLFQAEKKATILTKEQADVPN